MTGTTRGNMLLKPQERISALELARRSSLSTNTGLRAPRRRNHNENTFVRDPIIRYLRAMGVFCYSHSNTGIKITNRATGKDHWIHSNMRGISDIIGWLGPRWGKYSGRFVAVECKYGDNKASPEQAEFLRNAKESHCISILAYDVKDVEKVLAVMKAEIGEEAQNVG
jgi:hypothetical protein